MVGLSLVVAENVVAVANAPVPVVFRRENIPAQYLDVDENDRARVAPSDPLDVLVKMATSMFPDEKPTPSPDSTHPLGVVGTPEVPHG